MSFVETPLDQLVDVIRGVTFPTGAKQKVAAPGLIACLRTTNVQDKVEWDDLLFVDESYVRASNQHVRVGDILVSMSNSLELVGKCALITEVPQLATFGTFVAVVRPKPGVNPAYVFHAMRAPAFKAYIRSAASTTTNISNINASKLIAATVPDVDEPTRSGIASKIDELFSRIEEGERALERVQTLVERYRQSVLKAAVTGELTREWRAQRQGQLESGDALLQRILKARRDAIGKPRQRYVEAASIDASELPELPSGWAWASLEQLCSEFGNGLSRKPAHEPPGLPILRISAVRSLAVNSDDVRYYQPQADEDVSGYWVGRGDILFTRYNGTRELVGVSGVFKGAEPVLHPDKLIRARVVDQDLVDADYLALCLNSGESWRHIARWVKTSAGQHGIAGSDIKRTPVPLAPVNEQRRMVDLVAEALSRCDEARTICAGQRRRSQALRQATLRSAFAGELVTQGDGSA